MLAADKATGNSCKFVSTKKYRMKRILLFIAALSLTGSVAFADGKNKKAAPKPTNTPAIDTNEISWISLDEVQKKMKVQPRKVYIDVYTSWCGWCKVMDKKTFSNRNVIKYINTNFYAVKLDAEQKDSIHFLGHTYGFVPENRANQFAIELLRGQMSYPTTVILEENFQNPQPIPGYQDVKNMEMILKYLGENIYKSTPWDAYQKAFTASWE